MTTAELDAYAFAPAALAAVAAVGSAVAAAIVYRNQKRWNSSDAFLRISELFETKEMRNAKDFVYRMDREDIENLTHEDRQSVREWGAQLDICATVLAAGQIDRQAFFRMYGDVILRSVYQLAPYLNQQRRERGEQFLLPLSDLALELISEWRWQHRLRRYPKEIRLPNRQGTLLTRDSLCRDPETKKFLAASRRKWL